MTSVSRHLANATAPTRLIAIGVAALLFLVSGIGLVQGLMNDSANLPGNSISTDVLAAPTGLAASAAVTVSLSWGESADLYASGYRVYRAGTAGGPYSLIAEVAPRSVVEYTDNPGTGTFYYIVTTYYENWESVASNEATASVAP